MRIKMLKGSIILLAVLLAVSIPFLPGCKQDEIVSRTSSNPLAANYLKTRLVDFSLFSRILDTTGYNSFLNAYGLYTCFIPTNNAINSYLSKMGKSSITELSIQNMKDIVKFHVLKDTFDSKVFTDGKIKNPNMYGQYLSTGTKLEGALAKVVINRQATVLEKDIRVENGIIHIIDNVLEPAIKTVGQIIEENPDYSFFTQALKETGLFDSINPSVVDTANITYYTIVGESNSVLTNAGFDTYQKLRDRYCSTGNPKNPTDSLNLYVKYHIIKGLYYVADIFQYTTLTTLEPSVVISTKVVGGDTMFLNDDIINGIHYKGVIVNRASSDIAAVNGVFNAVNGHYQVRIQNPAPLYWDIADQPEARDQKYKFRQISQYVRFQDVGTYKYDANDGGHQYVLQKMRVGVGNNGTGASATMGWYFGYQTAPFPQADPVINLPMRKGIITNDDCFYISLRTNNKQYCQWVEFTTPMIIKGKYKVWVCGARPIDDRIGREHQLKVLIDGFEMTNIIYTNKLFDVGTSDDAMLQLDYKRYLYSQYDTADVEVTRPGDTPPSRVGYGYLGRMVGITNFKATQTHKLRFECALPTGNPSNVARIDMIHFIPVDMDQVWPKFNNKGQQVQKPN